MTNRVGTKKPSLLVAYNGVPELGRFECTQAYLDRLVRTTGKEPLELICNACRGWLDLVPAIYTDLEFLKALAALSQVDKLFAADD